MDKNLIKPLSNFKILVKPFVVDSNGERINTSPQFVEHHSSEVLNINVINKCKETAERLGFTHLYSISIENDRVFLRGCEYHEDIDIATDETETDSGEIAMAEFYAALEVVKKDGKILAEGKEKIERETTKKNASVDTFIQRRKKWSLFGKK